MYGHVYETTNNINGKKYIGQHQGDGNDEYLGSGLLLQLAIVKYGKENFSKRVIFYCDTKEELDFSEKLFIAAYRQLYGAGELYNMADGGEGGAIFRGHHHSEDTKRKIREANIGKESPFKGKHHSEETKKKQRELNTGENNPMYGKQHSEETKQKQREANIGKRHSEEAKRIMSEKRKEYWRKKKEAASQ